MVASAAVLAPPRNTSGIAGLQELIHALLKRWWLIALIVAAAVLVALWYLSNEPTIYRSVVVVQVEQEEQKAINIEVTTQDLRQLELLKTIEQNFANQQLMQQVVAANNAALIPGFVPPPSFVKSKWLKLQRSSKGASGEADEIVQFLLDRADAKLRRGTRLIDVSFDHEDPKLARQIAESIVQESIKKSLAQRQEAAETASSFLNREAEALRARLQKSEYALQDYKEKTGSVSMESRQNVVVERLREISSEETKAHADRLRAEADYAQIEAVGSAPEMLLTINSIATHPSVVPLRAMVATQAGEIAKLEQRYTREHPKMIQAQSQLTETRRALEEAVTKASQTVRNTLNSAIAREKSLEIAKQDQEKQALELSRQSIDYHLLIREVEADRELYEAVRSRVKETTVAMAMQPLFYRIVEPATVAIPVRPRKLVIMAAALMGGLMLGACTVRILDLLDTVIQSVDQAEELLGVPVLAAVPMEKETNRRNTPAGVVHQTDSLVAEAFRSLRTSLVLLGRPEDRKIVAVTSAVAGEGKTFVGGNLAACFAQQGMKTLLIDADLRRPAVEKLFFSTSGEPGLREYLTGQARADAVIRETPFENLFCISAGGRAPNPAELLAQPSFHSLMIEVASRFDRVIIDTAPVNVVSDTLVLAKHVQTICVVVDSQKTHRKAVRHALSQLSRIQAPVAGVILNRLPLRGGSDYFYHYSSDKPYADENVETSRKPSPVRTKS